MHASQRGSRTDAVSEVVGQILIFGILSTVLLLSLLAFNAAQAGAQDRVVEVRAESAAQRVAGTVVEAALFAERTVGDGVTSVGLRSAVDLPQDLEGRGYRVTLQPGQVTVTVGGATVQAGLFAAGAPVGVQVCQSAPLSGGPLEVVVTTLAQDEPYPACLDLAPAHPPLRIITLESV